MTKVPNALQDNIDQTLDAIAQKQAAMSGRMMVAIAGPPGAGKSTLAEAVVNQLEGAVLVPMDGFHLDNRVLEARGLLGRKGAPQSFDGDGFLVMVERLRSGDGEVIVPVFDRSRDIAIAGCQVVDRACQMVVLEGNYLLLNDAPWRDCRPLFDLTVCVAPPLAVLEERLIARWLSYGLGPQEAKARAMGNDIANARLVLERSSKADLMLG